MNEKYIHSRVWRCVILDRFFLGTLKSKNFTVDFLSLLYRVCQKCAKNQGMYSCHIIECELTFW